MKKIEGLGERLKSLTVRDKKAGLVPTMKDVLSESVGRKKPESAKQSVALFKLTDKILEAKNSVEVGDVEYDMIKECLAENPAGYFPYYHGQVMEILDKIK